MPANNIYKNHPYDNRQGNNQMLSYNPEQTDYMNGAKYHGGVNQTIIGLSKTHGMDIDGINGMRR